MRSFTTLADDSVPSVIEVSLCVLKINGAVQA